MAETQPKYDAALLHVYGYKDQTINPGKKVPPLRPALRSRLVIAAARELFERGLIENFILSGQAMIGKVEAVSTLTARELVHRTHIDPEHVFVNPDSPVTTSQELRFLHKIASQKNWSKLLCIGWELHRDNVEILIPKKFKRSKMQITFKSAKEILGAYPSLTNQDRYGCVIDNIENSPGEKKWAEYEKRKNKIVSLPFGDKILDLVARVWRPKAD